MAQAKRAIWIVLDGVGLEALPDAADYGDEDAATLPHVAAACGGLKLPNLQKLGLGSLAEISGVPPDVNPSGAHGRLAERSAGKDSIIGHWELAGVVVDKAFATYPNGFPDCLVKALTEKAGAQPLGNLPAGGLSVLKEYGAEHVRTGRPILYTSVDSVLQIAAHEEVIPLDELYRLCREARVLADDYDIARVIARPFLGTATDGFHRTPHRKDFPVPPPSSTLLQRLTDAGCHVSAVGKISDLFAGRGISRSIKTENNAEGMAMTLEVLSGMESGLLMVNLIDFDTAYGHRKDVEGFGQALEEFDVWLKELYGRMRDDDLLLICADHGCDPTTPGTDHTREYVPVLAWSKEMNAGVNLGDRDSFADVGASLAGFFGIPSAGDGESFLNLLGLG